MKGVPMPKDEWGVKRLCPHCGSRFYDLQRDPMTCPECGHTFSLESLLAGRGRVMAADKSKSTLNDNNIDTDDEVLEEDTPEADIDDDLLEDDEDDNVSLDDLADVAGDDEDN